jgi:hypothetical protein
MRALIKIIQIGKANSGSAIIYAMIAGASVSLGFVMLLNTTDKVEQDIRTMSNSSKYRQLQSLVKDKLMNSKSCTAALSGKSLVPAFTPNGMSLLPFNLRLFNNNETLDTGWRSPLGNNLEDIRLYINEADLKTDIKRDIPSSISFNAVRGKVHLLTTKGTPGLQTPKHQHLIMDVMIYYTNDVDKILYSCFSDREEEALCTLSGRIFNTYNAIAGRARCEPEKICQLATNAVVADPTLCAPPYAAKEIGGGSYFCMWCNQNYTVVIP